MSKEVKADESDLTMRAWDFVKDHEKVTKLLDIVFEKELEKKGLDVKVVFEEFKSMLPLFNFMGIFNKNYKHSLDGYVFETKEGEIIASVNIAFSMFYWEVAMVATHPDYRRRGLARKLVTAAIEHAKKCGAQLIGLEVLDINEPAYKLYRNLDFVHYDSITRKKLPFNKLSNIPEISLPEGYELREFKRNKSTNLARYELDCRVTPEDVQNFFPIDKKKYFKPLLIKLLRPIAKILLKLKRFDWLIYNEERLVGSVGVFPSRKEGSPHRLDIMIDPKHSQILSEPVLSHLLITLKNNSSVDENILAEFRVSETDQLEATNKFGFDVVEAMHLLGLKVEE